MAPSDSFHFSCVPSLDPIEAIRPQVGLQVEFNGFESDRSLAPDSFARVFLPIHLLRSSVCVKAPDIKTALVT